MKKILIVDDSHFMRSWLKKILNEANHNWIFQEADNGLNAIKTYSENKPNFVLMDISMPKLNGIEALKEIIRLDSNANIVMCSSLGQQQYILEAMEIGAKDFIVKPHFKNLIPIVKKYL